jgi:hypothetical protein
VLIRSIRAADLRAIHAINEAGAPGVHTEPPEQLAAITRESCIALVAEVDGAVAAENRRSKGGSAGKRRLSEAVDKGTI